MRKIQSLVFTLSFLCLLFSCADQTDVGSGLLGSEDLEVTFTDDFDIVFTQIAPAPLTQSRALNADRTHSLGTLTSAAFGESSASFYVIPTVAANTIAPDFRGSFLDSIALTFQVDTSSLYGNPLAFHDIEVFELEERIVDLDTILTDQTFSIKDEPLGVVNRFVPGFLDSILLLDSDGDTMYAPNVLRIPLNRTRFGFGQKIFSDTLNNNTAEGLNSILNGFYVRSTSNNSLLQLNLNDAFSSLIFYYRDSSLTNQNYPYRFDDLRPQNFSYDISGSEVEQNIATPTPDGLFYLQGQAGTTIEIDISDVKQKFDDPFINFASVEIFVQQDGLFDNALFPYPPALDLFVYTENGDFIPVIDLGIGQIGGQTAGVFDGEAIEDGNSVIFKYEMNITNHLKEIFKDTQPSKLYLIVRDRVQTPNSLILYGPDHPTLGAKLKLTYTKS